MVPSSGVQLPPSPMSQTRQHGENMRVQAFIDTVVAVSISPSSRASVVMSEIAKATALSGASSDTFGSELFSVTHPYVVPVFTDILEFARQVQSYPRNSAVRREHALTQEVIRLTRTLIGDYGATSAADALKRAKARFAIGGDYDPDRFVKKGSPGRGWRNRL